jgi:hypothetical protein
MFAKPELNPWFYLDVDGRAMKSTGTTDRGYAAETNEFLSQFRVTGLNLVVVVSH